MKNNQNRIEGINFLRIFSMLLVLFFHAHIYSFQQSDSPISKLMSVGAIGVTIFIVISGFGLRSGYNKLDMTNKDELKKYYKKRIASIYPIYILFVILAFILKYNVGKNLGEVLLYLPIELSMLPTLIFPAFADYGFNNNLWFLSTLFFLYLIFPFINLMINYLTSKKKVVLCFFLTILSFYIYYINVKLGNGHLFYYVSPIFRSIEFCTGILVSDIIKEYNVKKYFRVWYIIPMTIILIISIHLLYSIFGNFYNLYNIVVIPYTLFYIICVSNGDFVNKIASTKLIKYITSLCLCLYLCQSITIYFEYTDFYKNIIETTNITSFWLYIILTFLFAIIVNLIIEKPLNYFIRKKIKY